jgi:hypothetical protein
MGCGTLAQGPVQGAPLPDFRASVRFNFRERLPEAQGGQKAVTAPGYHEEALPPARFLAEQKRRVIQGKVPDLPFDFNLRLSRPDAQRPPLLEVDVVDAHTGQSIKGFPTKQELTDQGAAFELPLTKAQGRQARRVLKSDALAFLTYVSLVVNLTAER